MRLFKHFFDFYINSSVHVALAVCSLTWLTLLEFHFACDAALLSVIFFATVIGYNFVKYFGIAKFYHSALVSWIKTIQIFTFLCFLFLCYVIFQLNIAAIFFITGLAVVTFFYAIPFLPKHFYLDSQQNLRNVSGLKVYLIALVWVGTTVFLPLINYEFQFTPDVFITATQRFMFVVVLMLPFEIRDLNYDSLKLATIPQKIGVKRTKIAGIILLIFFFLLEFFKDDTSNNKLFSLSLICFITSFLILNSKKEQGKYYSSFWVESLPILWLILWFLCH